MFSVHRLRSIWPFARPVTTSITPTNEPVVCDNSEVPADQVEGVSHGEALLSVEDHVSDWKQEALLELAIALSFVPWHGAVVLLASHLAFVTAGGGK
ncbi:MAG: hypothetical protein A2107_11420 [Verrucomicrobia bacterium GWF2_62_7]|nr:MAG: hypothetical protein A2107_11420 [Verrucomicrobia bacterium GWF2_62_7]